MIQLLRLRPYLNPKTQKTDIKHAPASDNWVAPSHKHLIENLDHYINSIPESERWNVYYTALHCKNNSVPRSWFSQKVIPFDIDDIFDSCHIEPVSRIVFDVLKLDAEKTLTVWSGNGLQFLIELPEAFTDVGTFEKYKPHYKALIEGINKGLKENNLPGKADPSVWSAARLLRLPGTLNIKKDKGEKKAYLVQRNIEPQAFSFEDLANIEAGEAQEGYIPKDFFYKGWLADNKAILDGCNFLKECQSNPEGITEPQWYAMLSITARMENGVELSHNMSKGHPGYSPSETDSKVQQALDSSGPRTCKDINFRFGKCEGCVNFRKVRSPIQLKSEEHIATEHTGFHLLKPRNRLVPQYHDLMKYLNRKTPHRALEDNGLVFRYIGTHYEMWPRPAIHGFAEKHFRPEPTQQVRKEFEMCLSANNQVSRNFFGENLNGYINCKNGILNIKTKEVLPHSPEWGFRYCLPYDYNPIAKAPRFEKFLAEVTGGDEANQKVLEEIGGYAISGDEYWLQKTMLLVGSGANGKSTYLDALKMVAGSDNYAAVSLQDLKSENNRQMLEGKLFNVAPEISRHALKESEKFKYLSDGSEITVKLMWNQPYKIKNRAKMIFACNEVPESGDSSHGFLRRFAIVSFNQTFTEDMQDKFILKKFKEELPGILNIFIKGYERLVEQEKFTASASMEQEREIYAAENNPVRMFLDETDKVIISPLNGKCTFAPTTEIKKKFMVWCMENGLDRVYQNLSIDAFSKMFASSIPDGRQRKGRTQISGKRNWGYWDVEVKPND